MSFTVDACMEPLSVSNARAYYPTTNGTALDSASPPPIASGETVKIECNSTFFLNLVGVAKSNSYTITCNSTFHWEFPANPGDCVQTMDCSDPPAITNGNLTENYTATIAVGGGF